MRAKLDRKIEAAAEKRRYTWKATVTTSRRQPGTTNDPPTTAIGADEVLGTHIGEREQAASSTGDTDIPARLDRLPWSEFHNLVVAALGITWILDRARSDARRLGRRRIEGEPESFSSAMPMSVPPPAPILLAPWPARCSSAG